VAIGEGVAVPDRWLIASGTWWPSVELWPVLDSLGTLQVKENGSRTDCLGAVILWPFLILG
jgi:hypothetical protein